MDDFNDSDYSRKEFLKKSLLGMGAATLLPSTLIHHLQSHEKYYTQWRAIDELPEDQKLNIALVGLGRYATGELAPALQHTKLCKLNGIVTGHPSKAKQWKAKYDIPEENIYDYETYDRIVDNDAIDIIYIVLPNSMHSEYTVRGAQAGKHMISEKPMATSVKDAQAMVDACKKAGKKLSIGYRLHFEPYNQEIMHIGQNEVFGPVTSINGANGFTIHDPTRWRLDKKMAGGGPLMDMGIYVVQSSIYAMGKLPLSVTAQKDPGSGKLFREVEKSIHWKLEFPGNVIADGRTSYAQNYSNIHVKEQNGWAQLQPAYYYNGLKGKTSQDTMNFPQVRQQTLQMDNFADCILNDRQSRVPGEMGVRDMKILMAIYKAADTGQRQTFDWADDVPLDKV